MQSRIAPLPSRESNSMFSGTARPHYDVLVEAHVISPDRTRGENRSIHARSLTDIAQFIDALLVNHAGMFHTIQICPWTETSKARASALKSLAGHVVSPPRGMSLDEAIANFEQGKIAYEQALQREGKTMAKAKRGDLRLGSVDDMLAQGHPEERDLDAELGGRVGPFIDFHDQAHR